MGLFLQTAIIPDCEVWEVQEAVKNVEEWLDTLDSAQCSYRKSERGSTVLFNEDCCGYEELAMELSENLSSPVLLLYIYDEDFWGYYFYEKGVELDRFSPMPDYFEDCTPQERQRCAGNSALLARYFSVEQESIKRYLTQWTSDMVIQYEEDEERAYPDDEFGQCDCWQMADFMRKLGFPYTFGEEEDEPRQEVKVLPSLGEILSGCPADFPMEEGVWTLANLPSVLDEAYIRSIVTEETGEILRLLGSDAPFRACQELEKFKWPSPSNSDPVICILSAYCCWRMGNRSGAYYELYHAMPPALPFMRQSTNGLSEPDVILLLRARSLMVPVGIKRHISCRDLVRLRELDPENEDVYLLALAFFHFFDTHYHGTPDKAYADLEELRRIGYPGRDDGRIHWDGFPEDFLRFCERGEGQIRAGEIKSVNISLGVYPNRTPYGNPEK